MRLSILALGLGLLTWQLAAEPIQRTLTVTGEAEVRLAPDQALVTLGVESWATDLETARRDNDARMARLAAVPLRFGVQPADVKTDFVTIEPQYNRQESAPPSIVGYRVAQVLLVRVKNLTQVAPFVGAALGAGANRLDGVEFVVGDPGDSRETVRLAAAANAQTRAASLARALGQKLGRPVVVSESSAPVFAPRFKAEATFVADASGPSFSPGQVTISAQVSVQFELLD